jgi:hypothetical protein
VKIAVNFAISLMPRILVHGLAGRECAPRAGRHVRVLTAFVVHPHNRVKAADGSTVASSCGWRDWRNLATGEMLDNGPHTRCR